jgi:hypothetical protein
MTRRSRSGRFFIKLRSGRALRVTLDNGVMTASSVVRRRATTPLLLGSPEVLRAARALHRSLEADNVAPSTFSAVVAQLEVAIATSRAKTKSGSAITIHDPPNVAEFLLAALATTRAAEAMIGDLNERFATECKEFGRDRAVWLYWAHTLRSLWPLLKRAVAKAVKWGAVIAAVRRLF